MHQPVFDRHLEQQACGLVRRSCQSCVQSLANLHHVVANIYDGRPISRLVGWQASSHRVDAKWEQAVKFRIEGFHTENSLAHKVPIECLQVPDIENNSVSFWNRPIVKRL